MSLLIIGFIVVALLIAVSATVVSIVSADFRTIAIILAATGLGLAMAAAALFVVIISRMG